MTNLRHLNAIAGRLSLRPPQRRSLEILERVTEIVPPAKAIDLAGVLLTTLPGRQAYVKRTCGPRASGVVILIGVICAVSFRTRQ